MPFWILELGSRPCKPSTRKGDALSPFGFHSVAECVWMHDCSNLLHYMRNAGQGLTGSKIGNRMTRYGISLIAILFKTSLCA